MTGSVRPQFGARLANHVMNLRPAEFVLLYRSAEVRKASNRISASRKDLTILPLIKVSPDPPPSSYSIGHRFKSYWAHHFQRDALPLELVLHPLRDYPGRQRFGPVGDFFANSSSSAGRFNEVMQPRQALYFSCTLNRNSAFQRQL